MRRSVFFPILLRLPDTFMFAVVDIAGFQEKVKEGDKIKVPLLSGEEGKAVHFEKVLLFVGEKGEVSVGMPYLSGMAVEAKILGHGRGEKIRVAKMRRRKRYRRVHGHRQHFTEIEIMKIGK